MKEELCVWIIIFWLQNTSLPANVHTLFFIMHQLLSHCRKWNMLALESILHCLALTTLIPSARAYNFDTLVPTLVPSGMGSDHGFGFAMTQHQFSDGRKV